MEYKLGIKAIKIVDDLIDRCIMFILFLIFLVGLYFMADANYLFRNAAAGRAQVYKPTPENVQIIKSLSEDCVGWITINDSAIDYPLMQGIDNMEYLNKDAYGEYSLSGSIYLDSRNKSDMSDDYLLLYGHHMENDYMFGSIYKWADKNYFDSHRKGVVFSQDKQYEFEAFAFMLTHTYEDNVFNPENNYPLVFIKENSSIYYEPKATKIIALSTCVDAGNARHILFGTLREIETQKEEIHEQG